MARRKASVRSILIGAVVLFLVIQLVPYGRDHTNPPPGKEPAWNVPQTRELVVRACYNCHSDETRWPWYSHIAPFSWLIESDVNGGRHRLNFTQWERPQRNARKAAREVREGDMPPWYYLPMHPKARLSAAERRALIQGLQATLGSETATARREK